MMNDNDALPQNNTKLMALVRELQAKVEQQSLFIDQLLEQIRLARHQHFGTRSERFSLEQMSLAFDEAEAAAAAAESDGEASTLPDEGDTVVVPAHRRKKGGRRRLPKAFPRVEVVHELEDGECRCRKCLSALDPVSEKVSEQLDIQPATVRVIRHVRKTYACAACDSEIRTAPMPN